MTDTQTAGNRETPDDREARERAEEHEEFMSYVWGLTAAVTLTAIPFAFVYWSWLTPFWTYVLIAVFAVAQIAAHIRFFLHVGWHQQREDLQLILFSTLILIMMGGGTIWVLASLASRMH